MVTLPLPALFVNTAPEPSLLEADTPEPWIEPLESTARPLVWL